MVTEGISAPPYGTADTPSRTIGITFATGSPITGDRETTAGIMTEAATHTTMVIVVTTAGIGSLAIVSIHPIMAGMVDHQSMIAVAGDIDHKVFP